MSAITEDQYKKLKRDVEDAKAEADRAQGALDQLLERLKDEFECDDVKSAKALLNKLKEKQQQAQDEFEKDLKAYEKKWKAEEEEE